MGVYTYAVSPVRKELCLPGDPARQFPGEAGSAWTVQLTDL